MADYGYGLSSPPLFKPRGAFTRPVSNLARARGIVRRERESRAGGAGRWGFRTASQVTQAARDWPMGFARSHGGRSVPEVRRDKFLNTLLEARGAEPMAPTYRPSLSQRMQTWGRGVVERAGERSFWDTRRATPGGYR